MKNKLQLLSTILLIGLLFNTSIFGQVNMQKPRGEGTSSWPYEIYTIENLSWLAQNGDEWDKYFIQTADINASITQYWDDANGTILTGDLYDDADDGTSAGNNEGFPPIGDYLLEFKGHYNGNGHVIMNLKINRSSDDHVGFFGYTDGAEISNVGVININNIGNRIVGGLVGFNHSSTISNSFSTGNVSGDDYVGGLVGYNNTSSFISNCYSTASATASNGRAGGLVGVNNQMSTINNTYSSGSVNGTSDEGGLVGSNASTISNSFWDTQTSGQSTSAGGTGKTTLQMKDTYMYINAGWDFVGEITNGTSNYWDDVNNGYPILSWQSGADGTLGPFYSGGSGTSGDPYLISTTADLVYLSQHSVHWTYYFKQTANLSFNLSETLVDWNSDGIADGSGTSGFTPIGNSTTKFTGTYDGQGHVISNLFINRGAESNIGLFGSIWSGDILNVGAENVEFTGTNNVGGLVGTSAFSSTINSCYSTGTVEGSASYVGGLVGTNASSTIRNCYSRVSVTGNSNVGGLIGFQEYHTLQNSYSTGNVTGNSYSGGLVGYEDAGSTTNSFWDTETSGKTISASGTGKTTANMKYYKTFTDAGWDFVTEGVNGNNDYWDADQEETVNDGYMILSWEDGADDVYRKYLTGNGTESNPYQISSPDDLLYLSLHSNDWDKHFAQVSHITFDADPNNVDWDLDEDPEDLDDYVGFKPIGNATTPFTGVYDGYAHYIANLFINRAIEDFVGFFGYTNGATIEKLGLHNVNIYGSRYIGALVGRALSSSISESYNTGSVESNVATGDYIGGFVGVNSTSSITNCYSRASVTGGDDYAGGLVGLNNSSSTIDKCYSTGLVTGDQSLGGLVGSNSATVTNSFWDTQTSGQATSSGGTGKTTTEMKLNSTFLEAGWESDIWNMDAVINNGYPYLDWVIPGGNPLPVEITSFTANMLDGKVELSWQTATEVNNYGFDVETLRATSDEWETIGFVEGSGNSNSPKNYTFIDENPLQDSVEYRLKQIDTDGNYSYYSETVKVAGFGTTAVDDDTLPTEYKLSQNYPNPFNPSTTISYSIPTNVKSEMSNVKLIVFDVLGKEVATLVNENQSAGHYKVEFNASNLSSGVYFYRLESGNFKQNKKLMLIK
ncbi:MAG: T9SS type A sorting domain-containing protein [Bacteroidetes bacterium]|nr:T9SS type A sorting domain-containing protein [Bacteroidota bacterium]MBU1113661.1 T9SS type A sorting domain-containing protein [Bacteroidota bacterium]MBU1796753.1 T9SS type A sorting domain-containing protein [Bacteroidota bacterium]